MTFKMTAPHQWPADGSLPEHVERFAQWLVTPKWERPDDAKNQSEYGRKFGHTPSQLSTWKREPRVKARVQELCDDLNLSTDRIQQVMNAVFRAAEGGDMKAATLYLQHANALAPKRIVIEDRTLSQLSDEELAAKLAEAGLA